MNHIYRVIFNRQTGTFQAVAETAKTPHKTGRTKSAKLFKALLTPISLALSLALGLSAHAAPTGGQVTAGQAVINQNGTITNINQSSQNAAINWQSFNVGKNETVNFNQPNAGSVTLNRVIGNERSVIDGAMNANGKVFISNVNGMLIGKDAKINVGSLVATTANISDDDVMNGRYQFTGEGAGSIENLGHISVPKGGVVALVAPIIKNGGTIRAHEGNVLLASAESFSITLPDNANFAYTLDKGTLQGLVDNGGAILADAGRVVLTAKGVDTVKKSLIKHSGNIEANTVQNKNGVIELLGDLDNSALNVSGSLKAEAKESGDGGFIETSAADVKIEKTAHISTKAENGKSGKWLLDPNDLFIAQNGVMNGEQVSQALKDNGEFHLQSTQGIANGKGDVIIQDEIKWDKGKLTITAQNDIHIHANLRGNQEAKLALEYGQSTSKGESSDYYINKGVSVNLPKGETFSIKQGSNGETLQFTVFDKLADLTRGQGDFFDVYSIYPTKYIAFGSDISAGVIRYTNGSTNFDLRHGFNGWQVPDGAQIHGLGNKIKYVRLDTIKKGNIGLFQEINNGLIRDLGMTNTNIIGGGGNVGGLVGKATNTKIINSYVEGDIAGITHTYDNGDVHVGGLIGFGDNVEVKNSYAKGHFLASSFLTENDPLDPYMLKFEHPVGITGGLIGIGKRLNIQNSYADIKSFDTNKFYNYDYNSTFHQNHIHNRFPIPNTLPKSHYVGGLVGYIGGLGTNGLSVLKNNYVVGDIKAQKMAGGLVGHINWETNISNSYTNIDVNAETDSEDKWVYAGGLVGNYDSVATGSIIENSYTNGKVTTNAPPTTMPFPNQYAGGLVGRAFNHTRYGDTAITIRNSSFNSETNPNATAIGEDGNYISFPTIIQNVSGKTSSELRLNSNFNDWDFDNIWNFNNGVPTLKAFEPNIIVNDTPTTPRLPTNSNQNTSINNDYQVIPTISDIERNNPTGCNIVNRNCNTINQNPTNDAITDSKEDIERYLGLVSKETIESFNNIESLILKNDFVAIAKALKDLSDAVPEEFFEKILINYVSGDGYTLIIKYNGSFKSTEYIRESMRAKYGLDVFEKHKITKSNAVPNTVKNIFDMIDLYEKSKLLADLIDDNMNGRIDGTHVGATAELGLIAVGAVKKALPGVVGIAKGSASLADIAMKHIEGKNIEEIIRDQAKDVSEYMTIHMQDVNDISKRLAKGDIDVNTARAEYQALQRKTNSYLNNFYDNLTPSKNQTGIIGAVVGWVQDITLAGGIVFSGNIGNVYDLLTQVDNTKEAVSNQPFNEVIKMAQVYRFSNGDFTIIPEQ